MPKGLNLCWGVARAVVGGLEKGWVFLRAGSYLSGTPASSGVMRLTTLAAGQAITRILGVHTIPACVKPQCQGGLIPQVRWPRYPPAPRRHSFSLFGLQDVITDQAEIFSSILLLLLN